MSPSGRPRVLLAGGGAGLVGRALVRELSGDHAIRSVHRHDNPLERAAGVEWIQADLTREIDWAPLLEGVDVVVNLAWYRAGSDRRFRTLYEGLRHLLDASESAELPRFIQISVPRAPAGLEANLPYLTYKRRFDRDLADSGISHAILRPSALFGRGDVLLGVMVRTIHRYPLFPMFGDGEYHLSPLAASDLARIVRKFAASSETGTFDLGGPITYRYRELTDLIFRQLGKRPRYWHLSPKASIRFAWSLEHLGTSLLHAYEVEWLLADLLGLPPFQGLDRPLERVEPYLEAEVLRL